MFLLPHPSSRIPVFPSYFPHSSSPQHQDPVISLLSFPVQFNCAEIGDILPPQCIPSSNDGVAGTWIHTKRDSQGCNTIQELREPGYSHPILRPFITTPAQGHLAGRECKALHGKPVHRVTCRRAFHELWQIPVKKIH